MPKHLRQALVAGLTLFAAPAFADAGDPPLALVPADQRLTLLLVFAHAHPVVKFVLAGLVLALAAALVIWVVQIVRLGQRRSQGAAAATTFLSALGAAGPLIGLFGAAYGLLDSFIGVANVRPAPSLSILAPGLAEAALCVCLGLLAAAVAVVAHRHLTARLYAVTAHDAPAASPALRADSLSRAMV